MKDQGPVIGLTCLDEESGGHCANVISQFGGNVRLITPENVHQMPDISRGLEGLLLAGPGDLSLSFSDDHMTHLSDKPTKARFEESEMILLKEMMMRDAPVLGIGRGMQILNAVSGGTLNKVAHGHVADGTAEKGKEMLLGYHRIFLTPGSKLAATVGSGGFVRGNSYHQHGLRESGKSDELMTSAWSVDDGLIEALESPTHNWVIGVQFHPERRGELPPHFDGLFRTLVGKSQYTR